MTALPRSEAIARDWLADGTRVVACTLVETVGSAPLDPGAEMVIDDSGRIEGSVTGGCVEGALVEEAERIFAGGAPRVASYGISDADAVGVGLMCGGTVRVFVHGLDERALEPLDAVVAALEADRAVALATLLDGDAAGAKMAVTEDGVVGTLGVTDLLDRSVERDARGSLDHGLSAVRSYSASGEVMGAELRVCIQAFATRPAMVIFGAIDFSVAVAKLAGELGFRVTICDAREPFIRSPRFSRVADVVVDWPDRHLAERRLGPRDVVLVFTHDTKFDEPALIAALETDAGYIGALGSRRTHADRVQRLRERGIDDDRIGRIASPSGLDIGARTPVETAISILAEVIARRTGRSGEPLRQTAGPIHGREAVVP
jgi:xanthine dehydrogenase accessory factor